MARTSTEESWVSGAAQAAAIAGIALIDPRDLEGRRRLAYRLAVAGVAGWGTWSAMDDEADDLPAIAGPLTVAAAVGGTLAVSRWSESWDARIHDRLARAGVARPRLVIAATSAGMTMAGWWLGRRADRAEAARRAEEAAGDRPDAHS